MSRLGRVWPGMDVGVPAAVAAARSLTVTHLLLQRTISFEVFEHVHTQSHVTPAAVTGPDPGPSSGLGAGQLLLRRPSNQPWHFREDLGEVNRTVSAPQNFKVCLMGEDINKYLER